jgi:hypothetical protein
MSAELTAKISCKNEDKSLTFSSLEPTIQLFLVLLWLFCSSACVREKTEAASSRQNDRRETTEAMNPASAVGSLEDCRSHLQGRAKR